MLAQIKSRLSSIPRKIWAISAAVVLVLAAGIALLVIIRPFDGPFTSLSAANPSLIHPDGLAVSLAQGSDNLQAQVTTAPREAFLADQAGAQWVAAHQALPATLTPLSPIYTIKVRGAGQAVAEMAIPNGAEPLALLDLYRWDQGEGRWVFVPSSQDTARQVIVFSPQLAAQSVMAFHAQPEAPAAGVVVSEGGPDLGANYGLAMPEGVSIDAQGNLVGAPAASTASTVMPLIKNLEGGFLAYPDPAEQTRLIDQLMPFTASTHGLVLDFRPGQGYGDFLTALAGRLHEQDKRLDIVIRGTTFDAAELTDLASQVDRVWLAPGDNPMIYLPGGAAEEAIKLCVGRVGRNKLGLWVSGLNVEVAGDTAISIGLEDVLAPLGSVEPVEGYFDPNVPLAPGDSLALRLVGPVEAMGFDPVLGMNYLSYHDSSGLLHNLYLSSARSLNNKLVWANTYGLAGVAVYGLAHPQAPTYLADGLSAFLGGQTIGEPEPMTIVWRVTGSSGAMLDEKQGDLSLLQYLWQVASDPGEYEVSAGVKDDGAEAEIGKLVVNIGVRATDAPTPTATPTAGPTTRSTPDPNATSAPKATVAPVTGAIAAGAFELGGQTQSLASPDKMKYAGMTWVKFQHKWGPGDPASAVADVIRRGHDAGFKVLLSIPGASAQSIDFAAYTNFLSGVAALGPDGIEIWNEENFDREWPANDISGTSYVNNMLAPAFNAIKSVNPNILVISGAPTPSGAFGGCGVAPTGQAGCDDWFYIKQMADAGAANYADCIGVHFNSGATSPSASTGHPADGGDHHYSWYYPGMVNLYASTFGKSLCFTELGYVSPEGYGSLPSWFAWGSGTTAALQAQWLAETAVLASQSGQVRLIIVFNVDFTVWEPTDPQAGYAMVRPGGSCPACDALHNVQP